MRAITNQPSTGRTYDVQLSRPAFVCEAAPATEWLTDRQATQKLALDDVLNQIRGRVAIYHERIAGIENAKCVAFNRAFSWHLPPEQPSAC